MKKAFTLLMLLACSMGMTWAADADTIEWNFSTWDLQTISEKTVIDDLTLYATSSKTIVIDESDKTVDGVDYSQRLKFGGTGTFDNDGDTARIVAFDVTGDCEIYLVLASSSSSAQRTLNVATGADDILTTIVADSIVSSVTYSYTGDATTIYLYSASSGINIYDMQVRYAATEDDDESTEEEEEATTTYTHLVTMECDPAEGDTVNTLDTVLVTFPDYSSVSYSKTTYVYKEGEDSYVTYCNPSQSSCDANQVLLALKAAQTDNGKYYVVIRMGNLTVDGSLASSSEYNDSIVFYVDSTYVETETEDETEEEEEETVEVSISMINPVDSSAVDSLYAGDYVQFTIEPNDEVGYAYYKINSITGEVHTSRSTLSYDSSTGYWQSEVVYDKAFTDSIYYIIAVAYASENDYNYDRDALAEDTFVIFGAAEPYEYSTYTMVSADPENEDSVYIVEGEDLVCVYTFDGPVTMDSETTYVVYGQGITYNFSSIEATGDDAEEINGTTYSTEWTLTVDNSTLYEFWDDWITLCIVATDSTGARVQGDLGEDNQTYFYFEYWISEVAAAEATLSLTASDPEDEATIEELYEMYYTVSGTESDIYVNDDVISDIMVYCKTAGTTYTVSSVTVVEDADEPTILLSLADTITTTGLSITVSLPEALVGDTTANKTGFVGGNISADTVFYYTIGVSSDDEVVTVVPEEGTVESLSSFVVTFESHTTIGASWYYYPQLLDSDGETIKKWNLEGSDTTSTDGCIPYDWDTWTGSNSVYLNLDSTITDEGTYTLLIPEGTFIFDDIADSVNDEISFTYVISDSSEEDGISNVNAGGNGNYSISVVNGCISVNGADNVSIYSLNGALMGSNNATVPAGIYIVKAGKNATKVVVK